jgi:hypothetical protein
MWSTFENFYRDQHLGVLIALKKNKKKTHQRRGGLGASGWPLSLVMSVLSLMLMLSQYDWQQESRVSIKV